MKTEHIPFLLTIANTGSINKASVKLNYPVQKLSTIMTNVENEFNAHFFERGHHGIILTEEGKYFIRQLRAVQTILLETKNELSVMNTRVKCPIQGEVLLYSVPIFNDGFYVSAFKALSRTNPDVYLNLLTDSMEKVLEHVANDRKAIGLVLNIREDNSRVEACLSMHPELLFYPMFRRTLAVVCKKDSPFIRTNQKTISLKSLQDIPYVAWSIDKKCAESSMINHISCSQIKYHTANKELFFEMLSQKECFSVIGVDSVHHDIILEKYPTLVTIPLRDNVYSEDTIVINREALLGEAEKSFLRFLFNYRENWSPNGIDFLDYSGCEKPNFNENPG